MSGYIANKLLVCKFVSHNLVFVSSYIHTGTMNIHNAEVCLRQSTQQPELRIVIHGQYKSWPKGAGSQTTPAPALLLLSTLLSSIDIYVSSSALCLRNKCNESPCFYSYCVLSAPRLYQR